MLGKMKNYQKIVTMEFIFSKVSDLRLTALLKMNSCTDIFRGVWLQIYLERLKRNYFQEQLFSRTPPNGCCF